MSANWPRTTNRHRPLPTATRPPGQSVSWLPRSNALNRAAKNCREYSTLAHVRNDESASIPFSQKIFEAVVTMISDMPESGNATCFSPQCRSGATRYRRSPSRGKRLTRDQLERISIKHTSWKSEPESQRRAEQGDEQPSHGAQWRLPANASWTHPGDILQTARSAVCSILNSLRLRLTCGGPERIT